MRNSALLSLFLIMALAGCGHTHHPRPSLLGQPQFLPDNWLTIDYDAWQLTELSDANRNKLSDLRTKLTAFDLKLREERRGQYYNFFGKYKPSIQDQINAMQDQVDSTFNMLDNAYFDLALSSEAILTSLTPDMHGLAETHAENDAGVAFIKNTEWRQFDDDIRRALMLDRPSSLSPYPVVDD